LLFSQKHKIPGGARNVNRKGKGKWRGAIRKLKGKDRKVKERKVKESKGK